MSEDDLHGWSNGELVTIARWHLMRGLGLDWRTEDWSIEYGPEGITCQDHQPVDEHLATEGLRLLAHVYPRTRITLRRHHLTEYDQAWR